MSVRRKARLVLADGSSFDGFGFGAAPGEGEARVGGADAGAAAHGEVVFQTGLTGYQEVLTDPSYRGQIVVMTASHIGNTGINRIDAESRRAWPAGFVVRELCRTPSSWRSEEDLDSYLAKQGVVGVEGIDTRALVRRIREGGAQTGLITFEHNGILPPVGDLVARARALPKMEGRDLASEVTCAEPYSFSEPSWQVERGERRRVEPNGQHVVVYDFGVKKNQLSLLVDRGFRVTVVPATTSAAEVQKLRPQGVLLSNGPGDPAAVGYAIESVKSLLGKVPIMGVCLGHQILGLALGARTYKLRFGHHGNNQPVKDLATGRVAITSHNHGFAVDSESLMRAQAGKALVTHTNLNDGTCEGLRHAELRAFSVQYHPEAAPGPHDAEDLFDRFAQMMAGAA